MPFSGSKGRPSTNATVIAVKILLRALYIQPLTKAELHEVTGMTNTTISRWIKVLHTKPGMVYISGYKRVGERGCWSALWSFGFGQIDALRPRALTMSEYNVRWRERKAREARILATPIGVIHVAD